MMLSFPLHLIDDGVTQMSMEGEEGKRRPHVSAATGDAAAFVPMPQVTSLWSISACTQSWEGRQTCFSYGMHVVWFSSLLLGRHLPWIPLSYGSA